MKGLKRGAGIFGAHLDSGHAVFADDPAPERVVEIDDQTLSSAAGERHEEAHPLARHVEQMAGGDGQSGHQPFALVVPMLAAVACDERIVIEDVHPALRARYAAQFAVEMTDEPGLSGFGLAVEYA